MVKMVATLGAVSSCSIPSLAEACSSHYCDDFEFCKHIMQVIQTDWMLSITLTWIVLVAVQRKKLSRSKATALIMLLLIVRGIASVQTALC